MDGVSPYRTILLATDGSPEAGRAAAHAFYLAQLLKAKVFVLYVVDLHRARSMGVHYQEAVKELREEGKQTVALALDKAKGLGVEAEGLFAEGRPGDEICRTADERQADLIVMGARGRSAIETILLGSVSDHVLRCTTRPVLVLHD
ncbi:MAG: universal stress protein [Dehalococcoidales bacterium]|nr:universal stress protein [Dehalococcoidales bacterium]